MTEKKMYAMTWDKDMRYCYLQKEDAVSQSEQVNLLGNLYWKVLLSFIVGGKLAWQALL